MEFGLLDGVWFGNHGLVKAGDVLVLVIDMVMDKDVTESSGDIEVSVRMDLFGHDDEFVRVSRKGYRGRYD